VYVRLLFHDLADLASDDSARIDVAIDNAAQAQQSDRALGHDRPRIERK
jgi:hypothetical protein